LGSERRLLGLRNALQQNGIELQDELIVLTEGYEPQLAREACLQLISRGVPFTAVLCFDDVRAATVMNTLFDQGYRIPEDVSVAGFDDTVAALQRPQITTMGVDTAHIAELAFRRLLMQIQAPETDHKPELLLVKQHLIVRQTTVRPSAAGDGQVYLRP
jgi:LacI family transcriptional regulator